jgi:hypothetical protein
MDHATDLIAACLPNSEQITVRGICCVTGRETDCIPRGDAFGKSFTAQAELRAPTSALIGVAAARALSYRPERSSSWWCDGKTFVPLVRADVRERVLRHVDADRWAGYATTSYKKHGALRAPVNTSSRRVWLFENMLADMSDATFVEECWGRLTEMQKAGWVRPVLESLDPSPGLLAKLGALWWMKFEQWARPFAKGQTYQFLCYLLPSQKDLAGDKQD